MLRQIGFKNISALMRQKNNILVSWLEIRMKVGTPTSGQKHLSFEHDAIDAAAAVQRLSHIVFRSIGHRPKEHGDAVHARALDRAPQVAYHIVYHHRGLGQIPSHTTLGEEIVYRVDN